jgi:ABC-type maltose transport system permease subunit
MLPDVGIRLNLCWNMLTPTRCFPHGALTIATGRQPVPVIFFVLQCQFVSGLTPGSTEG